MSSHLRKFLVVSLMSLVAVFCQTAAGGALNVVKLLPDPARPRLYAVNNNGKTDNGSILVIDTLTHATIKEISVGKEPTDMDLTENSAELLVMNTTDRSISRIDLTTLAVTTTWQLTDFSNRNEDFGGHVADGPGNVIYYVDEQWGPRLRVYDTSTGKVLQTFGAATIGTANDNGFGDIVVKPDKSALFGWAQYGDGAGSGGSFAVRYNIAADGTLALASSGNPNYPTSLSRDPLDSKALISADGGTLIIKSKEIDQNEMDHFLNGYADTIYSMSPNARIVATSKAILADTGGETLYQLPATATVQAILPDSTAMAYFNPTAKTIDWLDLLNAVGPGALGLAVEPADGAVVTSPARLEWFPITGAARYQVFLGNQKSEVMAAGTDSPAYLGETSDTFRQLAPPLSNGLIYYWKVVPTGPDGAPLGAAIVRSFRTSGLALSRSAVAAETVAGVTRHTEMISLQSAAPLGWSATADVPWLTFQNNTGSAPANLALIMNASALNAGTYTGNVTIKSAGDTLVIPVSLRAFAPNFMIAKTDLELPWVYVVSQENINSSQPSFLLRIDTATNAIVSDIPCGRSVTDIAVHYKENRIYVTNWETGILRAFDRTSFQEVQTYQFTPRGPSGYGEGGVGRVAAGKEGRVILEEADQFIDMRLIDTADGKVIATVGGGYAGDGEADPTGRYYYHAGLSTLTRYDISADTFSMVLPRVSTQGSSVAMTGDGSKIAVANKVFDAEMNNLLTLPSPLLAATLRGDLFFTTSKAYDGNTGLELASLPIHAQVMAVTGDQKTLYVFPANSKTFRTVDLSTIAALPPRGLIPSIPDGRTVIGTDQSLAWSLEPVAGSYQLYFGERQLEVENATKSSPEYLGSSSTNLWTGDLPELAFGKDYFWRVDAVGFSGPRKGQTWSFRVAPLMVAPQAIDLTWPASTPMPVQQLAVSPRTSGASSWTASSATSWIELLPDDGRPSRNLDFKINIAGLVPGALQGSIDFHAGSDNFSLPVSVRIVPLNITKLVSHHSRPVVYGIHTAGPGQDDSFLLEVDAATAGIMRAIPIGTNPTDADLDAAGDRIYISNWGAGTTRVIDLARWAELPPLALGTDVYKLEVTPAGRIVTEQKDTNKLGLWETDGTSVASLSPVTQGDGEADPTGNYYYHCDNNISAAAISKYDISADSFVKVASEVKSGYGSRNLILSGDGSTLFWQGLSMNNDLQTIAKMPAEVYATNRSGELAIGADKIWWSDSAIQLAMLPFTSMVATVSANDVYLLRFNAATKTIQSTAITSFTDIPGPLPRPGQIVTVSPARLSWSPVADAISYRVFIASDAAALAAMTNPVATVEPTYYDFPSPLAFGRSYSWRIDTVTATDTMPGKAQSFTISFPEGPPVPALIGSSQGAVAASMSGGHFLIGGGGAAQLYSFDTATGATASLRGFTVGGYYYDHYFGSSVAADEDKAAVGAYSYDLPVLNGGAAFVYLPNGRNDWATNGPLSLPNPQTDEMFGKGLAASGNLMLAGTGVSYNRAGRVAAYIIEPGVTSMQTFGASDGTVGDGFGQVIAMEGNEAIIASSWRSNYPARPPSLYSFSRSTTTGLWKQTQKITIPGADSYHNAGTVLGLAGNLLATNNGATGAVEIFTRNEAGRWASSASIAREDAMGSSDSFGSGLAFSGDMLFIGDPGAYYNGKSGGAVFSYRRNGAAWSTGPVIAPGAPSYTNFGGALSARDGWLLATGGSPQPAWLFRVDPEANQIPRFTGNIPAQLVAGRAFSADFRATDADQDDVLSFDILQGPAWLQLTNSGNGRATLSGVPEGAAGSVRTVQLRVRDRAGAEVVYTYQLSLLSANNLPNLTLEPTGGEIGEGQDFTLRAAAEGVGPFDWQWYFNGQPIAWARDSTLPFSEIKPANSGAYSVSVKNAAGRDESSVVTITVLPANRYGGDWPTFGGSTRHAGFHPARLGKHVFVPAWSQQIHPTNALNRVAAADGRVYVSATSRFETAPSIAALDLETGDPIWRKTIPSSFSVNPPTWHDETVYFQRGKGVSDATGPQLFALDAATGTPNWATVFGAQWEAYEAPAVTDSGVYINGGTYGGMYGFDMDGTQRFFRSLGQVDGWTPTISNGHLYSWVYGIFQEHNTTDGATNWSVNVGTDSRAGSLRTVSAVSGDSAAVFTSSEIVCIDLPTRSIRWRIAGNFQGSPAISGGYVFGIQNKRVVSYSLADGSRGLEFHCPETIASSQPLLIMDYLFVASTTKTYVFDRESAEIVRTLPGGGLLSFADAHLFAAGTDGILRAWYASPALHFTSDPMVAANDRGDDSLLDLAGMLFVPDGAGELQWKLLDNSNPALFSNVQLDGNGLLQLSYAPYVSGSAIVLVEVKDNYGWTAKARVRVILPALPKPLLMVDPAIVFSRANGLYEQKVTVKNVAARAIGGFEVCVSGFTSAVSFYNATIKTTDGGVLYYKNSVAAGKSVTILLQYYAPRRGTIPQPGIATALGNTIVLEAIDLSGPWTTSDRPITGGDASGATSRDGIDRENREREVSQPLPFAIHDFRMGPGQAPVLEFDSAAGYNYRIQYSDDMSHWKSCPEILAGNGGVMSWMDSGPPLTDRAPAEVSARFYRIERIEP